MADDSYTIERSITIDASPADVYRLLVDFREWTQWSPWEDLDPELKRIYAGPESGSGASYRWSGNRKAGQGIMTITEAVEPATVVIDLVFEKPFKARNETSFSVAPEGDGSVVRWVMNGRKTFATKVMSVFKSMDALIGPDFEKGLDRLKRVAESRSDG